MVSKSKIVDVNDDVVTTMTMMLIEEKGKK